MSVLPYVISAVLWWLWCLCVRWLKQRFRGIMIRWTQLSFIWLWRRKQCSGVCSGTLSFCEQCCVLIRVMMLISVCIDSCVGLSTKRRWRSFSVITSARTAGGRRLWRMPFLCWGNSASSSRLPSFCWPDLWRMPSRSLFILYWWWV